MSSWGSMPISASRGSVSSRMRPLVSAMVSVSDLIMMSSGNSSNVGAQLLQLLFDALVATIDMIDAIDDGGALRRQPGNHQARRGAQVRRHHRRPAQRRNAGDDGAVALDRNPGPHPVQLVYLDQAVLEDCFGHCAHTLRNGVQGNEL